MFLFEISSQNRFPPSPQKTVAYNYGLWKIMEKFDGESKGIRCEISRENRYVLLRYLNSDLYLRIPFP